MRDEALELVREGHDLHYASKGSDPDLALLDGDRLYAAGLEKLAAGADLEAIRALADLISACAQAAAEERPGAARRRLGGHRGAPRGDEVHAALRFRSVDSPAPTDPLALARPPSTVQVQVHRWTPVPGRLRGRDGHA